MIIFIKKQKIKITLNFFQLYQLEILDKEAESMHENHIL